MNSKTALLQLSVRDSLKVVAGLSEISNGVVKSQISTTTTDFRAERGSRSSSIPATPAPTPNPLLYVSNGVFRPEQLAAGISSLRGADEGYVDDSASFPATPSPSPFSPSPAQIAGFTPDQVHYK